MSEEERGELRIIITSGFPKLIVTNHKDGRSVEVTIEGIKWSNDDDCTRILIEELVIQSFDTTAKKGVS